MSVHKPAAPRATTEDTASRLRRSGLRPTSQRCAVAALLFGGHNRHVEACSLHEELALTGSRVSLATIYNTLKDFETAGLLRRIAVSGDRTWFDTDTGDHRHFYIADENRILDCPAPCAEVPAISTPPSGYRITKVDVVIHLEAETGNRTDP